MPTDDDSHAPDDAAHNNRHSGEGRNPEGAGAPPAPNGADGAVESSSPYKGRGRREAAGEGTGDAPPNDAPAPADPADVPLDRFFIRF